MCHLKIDDFEFPRNTNAAAMPKTPNRAHTLDNHPPQPSHFHSHSSLALANMGMGVIDPVHPFPRSQKPPFFLSQYLDVILFYFPTQTPPPTSTSYELPFASVDGDRNPTAQSPNAQGPQEEETGGRRVTYLLQVSRLLVS